MLSVAGRRQQTAGPLLEAKTRDDFRQRGELLLNKWSSERTIAQVGAAQVGRPTGALTHDHHHRSLLSPRRQTWSLRGPGLGVPAGGVHADRGTEPRPRPAGRRPTAPGPAPVEQALRGGLRQVGTDGQTAPALAAAGGRAPRAGPCTRGKQAHLSLGGHSAPTRSSTKRRSVPCACCMPQSPRKAGRPGSTMRASGSGQRVQIRQHCRAARGPRFGSR
jgi:hypothetical protein